jgi:hypothetical protein
MEIPVDALQSVVDARAFGGKTPLASLPDGAIPSGPFFMKKTDQTQELRISTVQSAFRPATKVLAGSQVLPCQFDGDNQTRTESLSIHSKSLRQAHGRMHGGLNE